MSDSPAPRPDSPAYASRVLGLLAGGAAGDALGYTVEFSSLEQIRADYGDAGVAHPLQVSAIRAGGTIPVSDDTQMTLFVLDGLLDWIEWANEGSMADPAASVWLSCLRWYRTQTGLIPEGAPTPPARWLDDRPELHERRGPGNACLTGLSSPDMGLTRQPQNPDAKGCGTVMRSAPYGMVPGLEDHLVVSLARQGAVLTHGHPAAWTAAAAFALVVSRLMAGHGFAGAVTAALDWLDTVPDDGGTARALRAAVALAGSEDRTDTEEAGGPSSLPGTLPAELGQGWVAEEALAVAVYAVLATGGESAQPTTHFRAALPLAINHSGDSDSTASLAGQLLGARYGMAIFPDGAVPAWIGEREVIAEAAGRWTAATS
ncbi:ADP-ribosylglycohydrolase family protein [Citricoccus sp. I39-566]|uniref:ADP-ribosylglycohydrolase family protein n=1 Tax=Citricoccus sp. I39-566 TaxID=3073268 RepID=UPI00286BC8B7|nr:ADP-ribosylglycohydrolase family protein [Citricoccus sp. I39-566]WMY77025.1 ADP-ribosylglycohydrolase family protein [Citricoccus sp. I39-566]